MSNIETVERVIADAKEFTSGLPSELKGESMVSRCGTPPPLPPNPPPGPCRYPVPGHCTQRCRITVEIREGK